VCIFILLLLYNVVHGRYLRHYSIGIDRIFRIFRIFLAYYVSVHPNVALSASVLHSSVSKQF
jgi:hypothetical protein